MDIVVLMNDNTKIGIELQVRMQKYWMKRNLFYLGKLYTDDIRIGHRYDKLRRCITISILDFSLLPGEEYHSVFTLRDKNGRQLTDLLEVHMIELNKRLQQKKDDAVDSWIQLFNARTKEELEMIQTKNAGVLEAIEVVKQMNLFGRLRLEYEAALKAKRDRWAEDEYIRDEGRTLERIEILLEQLSELGPVPEELVLMIREQKDLELLKKWGKAAGKAATIEEWKQLVRE